METESKTENNNDDTTTYKSPTDEAVLQRSTIIGVILLIFSVTKMPLVTRQLSKWNVRQNECGNLCEFHVCDSDFPICDNTDSVLAAYTCMEVGLALIIVFSIGAMAKPAIDWLECNKNCSILGVIFMSGLIFGGLLYMIGFWIILDLLSSISSDQLPEVVTDGWHFEDVWNWALTLLFFEFWLGGVTAIIYGIDCFFKILDGKESKIFVFLSQLTLVSLVCFMGYVRVSDFRHKELEYSDRRNMWQIPLIASGYLMILVAVLVYCIIRKIPKIPNLLMNMTAGLLMLGSFLAAVGYWGAFTDPGDNPKNSSITAYNLLLITLSSFCALYMWDSKLDLKIYDSVSKREED